MKKYVALIEGLKTNGILEIYKKILMD